MGVVSVGSPAVVVRGRGGRSCRSSLLRMWGEVAGSQFHGQPHLRHLIVLWAPVSNLLEVLKECQTELAGLCGSLWAEGSEGCAVGARGPEVSFLLHLLVVCPPLLPLLLPLCSLSFSLAVSLTVSLTRSQDECREFTFLAGGRDAQPPPHLRTLVPSSILRGAAPPEMVRLWGPCLLGSFSVPVC